MDYHKHILLSFVLSMNLILNCAATTVPTVESEKSYDTFTTEEDVLSAWGVLSTEEQSDYAGVYINDAGNVVMLFKEGSSAIVSSVERSARNGNFLVDSEKNLKQAVVIETAKYSYQELREVYDLLIDNLTQYKGISTFSISNEDNCINIGIMPEVSEKSIKAELISLIQANFSQDTDTNTDSSINRENYYEDIFQFSVLGDEGNTITYSSSINGNSRLTDGIEYFSAAVQWYSDTYGEGFITTGHAPQKGDAVLYNSKVVGYVKEVHHDGKDDTAFVKFKSSYNWESITTDNEELVSKTPLEGSSIYVRGYQTTPYEYVEVLSNTFGYVADEDDIVWSDLIQVDYYAYLGDSGGAAYSGTIDSGRTTCVIGVISATDVFGSTYIVPAKNIENY